jgi:hypothetical protein
MAAKAAVDVQDHQHGAPIQERCDLSVIVNTNYLLEGRCAYKPRYQFARRLARVFVVNRKGYMVEVVSCSVTEYKELDDRRADKNHSALHILEHYEQLFHY